jgi:hypothetical protein
VVPSQHDANCEQPATAKLVREYAGRIGRERIDDWVKGRKCRTVASNATLRDTPRARAISLP